MLISALAAPIISVLLVLSLPFYFCFKYCCNCCGGAEQDSEHFCCPGDRSARAYYSTTHLRVVHWGTYLLCVAGCIACLLIIIGCGRYTGVYQRGFDSATSLATHFETTATNIDAGIKRSDGSYVQNAPKDVVSSVIDGVATAKKEIGNVKSATQGFEGIAVGVGFALGGYFTVFFIAAAVLAFFNVRICFPMLLGTCIGVNLLVLSSNVSVFAVLNTFVDGGLSEVKLYSGGDSSGVFGMLMENCPQDTLDSLVKKVRDAEATAASSGCAKLQSVCGVGKPFQCVGLSSTCSTVEDVGNVVVNSRAWSSATCTTANCSIPTCATSCVDSSMKDTANSTMLTLSDALQLKRVFKDYVEPLLSCKALAKLAIDAVSPVLEDMSSATGLTYGGLWLNFCVAFVFVFWCFHGSKTFVAEAATPPGQGKQPNELEMPIVPQMYPTMGTVVDPKVNTTAPKKPIDFL